MKILIDIQSSSTLLWHEALSMAFALATFEHEIFLTIGNDLSDFLMENPEHSLVKMMSSLDLYDIVLINDVITVEYDTIFRL